MAFSKSHAVKAKACAMYGKKLNKDNYSDLALCKNINDAIAYLKSHTVYAAVLEKLTNDSSVSQIEELLNVELLNRVGKLCRYEITIGKRFYKYFVITNDITQILSCIRMMNIGKSEEYLLSIPPFLVKHSKIDIYSMAKARTFSDILQSLSNTPYREILEPFSGTYNEPFTILEIENCLSSYMNNHISKIIDEFNGKERQEIKEVFTMMSDMKTVERIYRLKQLGSVDRKMLERVISVKHSRLSSEKIDSIINSSTPNEVLKYLADTKYGKYFELNDFSYLEGSIQEAMYKKFHLGMYTYTSPTAVMMCYLFLSENEIHNIIHIFEGINYGVSSDKILKILICSND